MQERIVCGQNHSLRSEYNCKMGQPYISISDKYEPPLWETSNPPYAYDHTNRPYAYGRKESTTLKGTQVPPRDWPSPKEMEKESHIWREIPYSSEIEKSISPSRANKRESS